MQCHGRTTQILGINISMRSKASSRKKKKDHLGKGGPVIHHHTSFYAEPYNGCLENLIYLSITISLQMKGYLHNKKA